MKQCKCKCGGCVKKGGAFMLETIFINGGYTFEDLKKLWGNKYYDYLLIIYNKLINNLEDSNKIISLILHIISLLTFQYLNTNDLNKIHSIYNFITIHELNYLYQAIYDNIHMEPFFVLRMSNSHNFVYSNSFIQELLTQNLLQYDLYKSYLTMLTDDQYSSDFKMAITHSSYKSTIVSFFSGNNLLFIKNKINWNSHPNVISAHLLLLTNDIETNTLKCLMLTHKPSNIRGSLIETDCHLGPPGGLIDPTDNTPWDAMVREYKEEVNLHLPNNFTLLNTFIWKKKYVIFVGSTETRITDKIIDNNEIYSRKWFDINDIKQIIKNKNTKQTKGLFKMRNGAVDSTAAIIDFMGY